MSETSTWYRSKVGVGDGVLTTNEDKTYCAIYVVPNAEGNKLKASCKLDITGPNQWHQRTAGSDR